MMAIFTTLGFLNPAEQAFAQTIEAHKQANPGKPLAERTIEEFRASTSILHQYAVDASECPYIDEQIPVRDGNSISIRIYNNDLPDNSPVMIFYPGCAFFFDISSLNNTICSRIAAYSKMKVIIVHYRLTPEYPMPISLYDSYDAAAYIATHFEKFGVDPNRIILGGWCTGAHCAVAVSTLARDTKELKVFHQILLSGRYDLTESTHTFDEPEKQDKTVSRILLRYLTQTYYGIPEENYQNPLLSPYYEVDFHDFPPTTILCAEFDALRNDSEGYYSKLKEAGIEVEKVLLQGQTHNTIMMRKVLSDGLDPAEVIAEIIKAL